MSERDENAGLTDSLPVLIKKEKGSSWVCRMSIWVDERMVL